MGFLELLGREVLVFDGAMGTMLQAAGLPPGGCPELWNLEQPDAVRAVHEAYVEAGARILETNTFGGARVKLAHYGLQDRVFDINYRAVRVAREAAGGRALVAGSIGPTGRFVEPLGEMTFAEAYAQFSEQAEAFAAAGADLVIIETMADLGEIRAAVLAVKERTGLPVIAQMTYEASGRTFTGTDPETAAVVLQAAGADVVGANCSLGPAELVQVVERLTAAARVPVSIMPNAGLPRLTPEGATVFPMGPDEFAAWGPRLVAAGAAVVGGCCGTTPEYIRRLAGAVAGLAPPRPRGRDVTAVASRTRSLFFFDERLPVIIGERINPTGRKKLSADVASGAMTLVRQDARAQVAAGAHMLDINVGVPGIDEAAAMRRAVLAVQEAADVPLSVDSSTPAALEAGLSACIGKPLVNSASGEASRLEAVLPAVRRFGAALIFLALDDEGIPPTAEGRFRLAERVLREAEAAGMRREDVFIDCLTLPVGAEPAAALETLKAIRLVKERLGLRTVLGLSNVSFGMPNRPLLNATFMAMALREGLDAAIVNPLDPVLMDAILAARVLLMRDRDSRDWTAAMAGRPAPAPAGAMPPPQPGSDSGFPGSRISGSAPTTPVAPTREGDPAPASGAAPAAGAVGPEGWCDPLELSLYRGVLDGHKDDIVAHVEQALAEGRDPMALLNGVLIPAIEEVGRLFGEGAYFLPQLMLSAAAMKNAFERLKPELARRSGVAKPLGTIVMATVEGDIHDIGKNICNVLLENHGFRVVDLGRDVPAERILEAARREKADMVGLSALMTTTMPQMKKVIDLFAAEGFRCPVIIGGAATDKEYARRIGAAGHGRDASEAVEVAKRVLSLFYPEVNEMSPAGRSGGPPDAGAVGP